MLQQGHMVKQKRMNEWNSRDIAKPPTYTFEYTPDEREDGIIDECITTLKSALASLEAKLQNDSLQGFFNMEAKILNVLLPQTRQHRVEKFYKLLKKLNTCVKRWQEMKLEEYAAKLSKIMPLSQEKNRAIHLPSRQMFEYLMVRIYGAYHLFVALETCCREIVPHLLVKLKIGHNYWTASSYLSIIARFRVLALDFVLHIAKIYDDVQPWIKHLKGSVLYEFISENSTSLVTSLRVHCRKVETDENVKEIKNSGLEGGKINILDIFDHKDNMEMENKMMTQYPKKRDARSPQNTISHTKEKGDMRKRSHCNGKKEQKEKVAPWGNFGYIDFGRRSKSADKQLFDKKREEVQSLLNIFDENSPGEREIISNHSKFVHENNTLSRESHCAVGSQEDIGEVAENGTSVKRKSKKRKRTDNKNSDSKKTKKKRLLEKTITTQQRKSTLPNGNGIRNDNFLHEPLKECIKSVKNPGNKKKMEKRQKKKK